MTPRMTPWLWQSRILGLPQIDRVLLWVTSKLPAGTFGQATAHSGLTFRKQE